MNELTIQGKIYISSKRAAEITGYAKDYIGQLCREGYVEATMVGRSWYVLEASINAHRFGKESVTPEPLSTIKDIDSEGIKSSKLNSPTVLSTGMDTNNWMPAIYTPEPLPALIPASPRKESVIPAPAAASTVLWPTNDHHSVGSLAVDPTPSPIPPPITNISEVAGLPTMQEAWQEWFTLNKQPLLETQEVIEERNEDHVIDTKLVQDVTDLHDTEVKPVIIMPISERFDIKPENRVANYNHVSIHTQDSERTPNIRLNSVRGQISEKNVRSYKRESNTLLVSALFMAVTLVICAIAFVGSGMADKYIGASIFRSNPIVNFLEGKTYLKR